MASINPVVMHLHLMAFAMVMIISGKRRSNCAERRYRDCKRESDLLHNVFHRVTGIGSMPVQAYEFESVSLTQMPAREPKVFTIS
ncbi:hypothetical protein [Caballeronia sordidicola]|uniref:hypothetical protein n=1 Tax=Caballeronia sordidicola TaxID=196367 RepID=UPI0015C50ACF|nr:hypothetical protein [Caballeronia sordidicola]